VHSVHVTNSVQSTVYAVAGGNVVIRLNLDTTCHEDTKMPKHPNFQSGRRLRYWFYLKWFV